jgi:hypothetical protein
MRVLENASSELVGYLTDISPRGFMIDTPKALAVNKDYTLRIELTPDVSDRSFIVFVARARWTKPDPFDPLIHIAGFQIVTISPHDEEIFNRMYEKYGSPERKW